MTDTNLHYFDPAWITSSGETLRPQVAVYGGTAAGVVAAIALARRGMRVVLLHPGKHLGGMTSGGLGWTDFGNRNTIGGLAGAFYQRVGRHYGKDEELLFEPHVAEQVLGDWVAEHDLDVRYCQYLDKVRMDRGRIAAVMMLGGLTVRAGVFIDATYEGDLLGAAGVDFTIGREDNSTYGETLNGVQVRPFHQFSHPVDPYVVEGDPSSGLLPHIEPADLTAHTGQGDRRIQAYCFRVCMTDDPALKVNWPQPAGFDAREYELARRWFNSEKDAINEPLGHAPEPDVPRKFDILPNRTRGGFHKTDTNNHGPVSSDFIGANWEWPLANHERRERLFQAHVAYQQGYYWFLANDPSIPARYRDAYRRWGLASDEFTDTGHWPHQLYVREARRLVGGYVVTEHDCRHAVRADDPVGMGSYWMDSHNCTRFVRMDGGRARVLNEGDVEVPCSGPYPISYRAIVPKAGQCGNLLVPVCFSASHIAYGSARMEPVFMVLGESAATAAALCVAGRCAVQDLPYGELRGELVAARLHPAEV